MTTDTRDKIREYIQSRGQARAQDIYTAFSISRAAAHRQLHSLVEKGLIVRVGKPPIVFYTLPQNRSNTDILDTKDLPKNETQIIEDNFLSLTPDGRILYGMAGFVYWKENYQKNTSLETLATEYYETIQSQKKLFTSGGWIDATAKLRETFQKTPIDHLLFEDIYSYPRFGRTKLAKLVMYAKQTGEKVLIDKISDLSKGIIDNIIKKYAIDAVGFIPPTIPRPVQFMDEFESRLQLQSPTIELTKVTSGDIAIPQKILVSLEERISNARNSIYLKNNATYTYKNVLLIDDVAGSGASFNETAKKLKNNNIGSGSIIAFGLVGNIKGYDVVRTI